jgi:hypothetical protein
MLLRHAIERHRLGLRDVSHLIGRRGPPIVLQQTHLHTLAAAVGQPPAKFSVLARDVIDRKE